MARWKEALNEKDQVILKQTRDIASIRYAISYVKDAAEMSRYRAYCGPSVYLAAKLERKHALDEALQMAGTADELWLCRGDLGAELGVAAMAKAVYRFSARVREFSIPVHLAGQVLEHMVEHPTPTRSEICYLYEAHKKGSTASSFRMKPPSVTTRSRAAGLPLSLWSARRTLYSRRAASASGFWLTPKPLL